LKNKFQYSNTVFSFFVLTSVSAAVPAIRYNLLF
jgi:hypothetical protein